MAILNNFTITSPQNQDILIYSNGSWINSNISGFFGILDGRYSANTHNHDGRYILKADAYTKSQTYPAASLYTKAEIDAMFDGFDPGSGGGGGSGLVNSASNVGSGAGVFHANASGDLQFRSLFSQDIDLLTIAVSGTSVIFTPKVPTWSKLTSANGQLTTSHVNFANQGVNTSSKPSFAGLTVDTGSWSSSGLKLTGAAPSIYFSQNDNSNAYVGLNTNSFYVLQDTNSDGSFETPYALQVNLDGSGFNYYGKRVFHEGHHPSWTEIAGKPAISLEGHKHNSIEIQDQRNMPGSDGTASYFPTPRDIEGKALSTYFGYYDNTGGSWKSSITVKGWSDDYSVWQLICGASTGRDEMLYLRTGRGTSWGNPIAIYHEAHKPTYSELGVIGTTHVDFANQYLNTGSSPTFNIGKFTGELLVENAQPWLRLNDTTGNDARIRNQSSVIYFDADEGNGNATVAMGSLKLGSTTPVELSMYSNGILEITSPSGFLNIGANNTGYAHLYTDRDQFYFNQPIQVDGYIKVYNKQSQFTSDGNHVLIGPNSAYFTRITNNGDIARKNTSWAENSGEQKVLRGAWVGNVGDYIQLQPAGNRSSNGTMLIGTNGFAVGLHDLNGAEADVRIPFTDTWMSVNTSSFWLSGNETIRHSDGWLRLNPSNDYGSGIYCANSLLRTDGILQVGNNGASFNATTSQIDLKSTTRVHGLLHVREIVSQDGNFTTIGAGELGNSLRGHVTDTLGAGNEGLHLGGENGVYAYSHPNNMTGGMDAGYSIRVLAPDGSTYINHLDVYKSQHNGNQVVARFRHPTENASIAIVSKNNDAGSFRFEANRDGEDLRIQTAGTSGGYFTSSISVGTIARFFRDGDVKITREVTAQDFIATSDIRVKKNLERIDSSLDKIAKLTGFTYDQVKLKQRKAGLIAQEVKEVLPEAVGEDKDGMLNISPMAVLALLVNAVNDLSEQIKELKR